MHATLSFFFDDATVVVFLFTVQSAAKAEEAAHSRELFEAEAEVLPCYLYVITSRTYHPVSYLYADQQNEISHHERIGRN
jgi:hypothetical protein